MNLLQQFSQLNPIAIASCVAAAFLALTRLLTTAKPLWGYLPDWAQGLVPVLVLALPQLAQQAAGVHTTLDLGNLLVLSFAMIVPGAHSHTVAIVKPNGPGSGAAIGLVFAFALSLCILPACSRLANVDWAKQLGDCAEPLKPEIAKAVAAVLAGDSDVESGLADIVRSGVPAGVVECTVAQLLRDIGLEPRDTRATRMRARGKAFLDKVAPQ